MDGVGNPDGVDSPMKDIDKHYSGDSDNPWKDGDSFTEDVDDVRVLVHNPWDEGCLYSANELSSPSGMSSYNEEHYEKSDSEKSDSEKSDSQGVLQNVDYKPVVTMNSGDCFKILYQKYHGSTWEALKKTKNTH